MAPLSKTQIIGFLETAVSHMEKRWDDYEDENYEYGNYILANFGNMWDDIADEATGVSTYERPAEVNNKYYELWKHYIATYDELKKTHTPCRERSLKDQVKDNMWNIDLEGLKHLVEFYAKEHAEDFELCFNDQNGDPVENPGFDAQNFMDTYFEHLDEIWSTNGMTSCVDFNEKTEQTDLSVVDEVVTRMMADTINMKILDIMKADIQKYKEEK
jgi:hypothetical protein